MKCYECQGELNAAGVCIECGAGSHKPLEKKPGFPLGYQQCEWLSGQARCKYPGSISTNTREGGPYYCRLHFGCESGHFGSQIVEASRDYQHPTAEEVSAKHTLEAKERLKDKGLLRLPGESPEAFRARCMAWMKSQATYKRMAA